MSNPTDKKVILKTLVGSQVHGLATPQSDFDYRGVFVVPTNVILSVNGKYDNTSWIEGKEDNTAHEIKDFLQLAIHSNPSVLETLVSPIAEADAWGRELCDLFPLLWNSEGVFSAFSGYSNNQRKKFLEDKDDRPWKYATAYIRVLLLGCELLEHGTMTVNIADQEEIVGQIIPHVSNLEVLKTIKNSRSHPYEFVLPNGEVEVRQPEPLVYSKGDVIDMANSLQTRLGLAYTANPNKKTDMDAVNEFLLRIRHENWKF